MQHTLLGLLLLVAASGPAFADEAPLTEEDLALVPMPHEAFELLAFEHLEAIDRLVESGERCEELREQLAMSPSAWRRAELESARAEHAKASLAVRAILVAAGVSEAQLDAIQRFPKGRLRADRYALAQVSMLPVRDNPERVLLSRIATGALGALLALDHERERLIERLDATPGVTTDQKVIVINQMGHDTYMVRQRFWLLVDYLLDDEAKRQVRAAIPHELRETEDFVDHASLLPGMSLGQLGRVRALEAEVEAELGPDLALAERLERQLGDDVLPDKEREATERALHQTWGRVTKLVVAAHRRLRGILTEAQLVAFDGIPPFVSADMRLRGPEELLAGVELTDAQTTALVPMVKTLRELQEKTEREMEAIHEQVEEMGPDSPQAQGMEMREAGYEGAYVAAVRAAMRTVFLEIMTPDQVLVWVTTFEPEDD